jgi:hypothetical protein
VGEGAFPVGRLGYRSFCCGGQVGFRAADKLLRVASDSVVCDVT